MIHIWKCWINSFLAPQTIAEMLINVIMSSELKCCWNLLAKDIAGGRGGNYKFHGIQKNGIAVFTNQYLWNEDIYHFLVAYIVALYYQFQITCSILYIAMVCFTSALTLLFHMLSCSYYFFFLFVCFMWENKLSSIVVHITFFQLSKFAKWTKVVTVRLVCQANFIIHKISKQTELYLNWNKPFRWTQWGHGFRNSQLSSFKETNAIQNKSLHKSTPQKSPYT